MGGCNETSDEATLHKTEKGCLSVRLLSEMGNEPQNEGGAQVGGTNQAERVPAVPLADSGKRDGGKRGGRT